MLRVIIKIRCHHFKSIEGRCRYGKEEEETLFDNEEEKQEFDEKQEYPEAETREVFEKQTKTFDYRKRRATDVKGNSRTILPRALSTKSEAEISLRSSLFRDTFREYREEKCNKRGEQESNLTKDQRAGLEFLKNRIKKKEIIVSKTDKTWKLIVMDHRVRPK